LARILGGAFIKASLSRNSKSEKALAKSHAAFPRFGFAIHPALVACVLVMRPWFLTSFKPAKTWFEAPLTRSGWPSQ
jgi:hypothetical protein